MKEAAAKLANWEPSALAGVGLAISVYLAVLHWLGEVPPCNGYAGCAEVNTSPYAEIFRMPVAALGALLYAGLLAVALWRRQADGVSRARATLVFHGMVLSGAVFMAYLTTIELFVLHALCYWCIALALITLVLLLLSVRDVARASPPLSSHAHPSRP